MEKKAINNKYTKNKCRKPNVNKNAQHIFLFLHRLKMCNRKNRFQRLVERHIML